MIEEVLTKKELAMSLIQQYQQLCIKEVDLAASCLFITRAAQLEALQNQPRTTQDSNSNPPVIDDDKRKLSISLACDPQGRRLNDLLYQAHDKMMVFEFE